MGTLETPEKSDDLVLKAIGELLRASGGDSTVALKTLLERTQGSAVAAPARSTVAERTAEFKRMLSTGEIEDLAEVEEMAGGLLGRIISNSLETESGLLDAKQALDLMQERLDTTRLIEVLTARYELLKAAIFRHITEVKAAEGEKDPENVNGSLDVPELGRRFAREGAGYGTPSVDQGQFRVLLGEEAWKQVCNEEEVPATTKLVFSVEKALDLARGDVTVLDKLKQCLIPGAPKSPKLCIRNISAKEK